MYLSSTELSKSNQKDEPALPVECTCANQLDLNQEFFSLPELNKGRDRVKSVGPQAANMVRPSRVVNGATHRTVKDISNSQIEYYRSVTAF